MFFRRQRPSAVTFSSQIEAVKQAGFSVSALSGGVMRVARGECAIDLGEQGGKARSCGPAGILAGDQISILLDGGYQKFFRTPGGKRMPATSKHLSALHGFEEDLKEVLGGESLYNQSLGTVSTSYLYDRLTDRDRGTPKRAWE